MNMKTLTKKDISQETIELLKANARLIFFDKFRFDMREVDNIDVSTLFASAQIRLFNLAKQFINNNDFIVEVQFRRL